MTDERIIPLPAGDTTETEADADERRDRAQAGPRPASDEDETNPLLREGPDAPDAADIEDPDAQL